MEKKLLDLNTYGVSELNGAEARKTNGGMTFHSDAMAMGNIDRHDVAQTTLFYTGFVVGFFRGLFGF